MTIFLVILGKQHLLFHEIYINKVCFLDISRKYFFYLGKHVTL